MPDVSRFHPKRRGDGITLDALLERSGIHSEANDATLHADRDEFHVSVPRKEMREQGIVVYRLGDARLGIEDGGPIRLLIRNLSVCHTGERDACANVEYLCRIEVTTRRDRDTRPATDEEHAALHPTSLPCPRSRAEGDSRSEANKVRQHEGRSSRHRARGNPGGRFGVVGRMARSLRNPVRPNASFCMDLRQFGTLCRNCLTRNHLRKCNLLKLRAIRVVGPTRTGSIRVLHGAIDLIGLAGAQRHGICESELAFQLNSRHVEVLIW